MTTDTKTAADSWYGTTTPTTARKLGGGDQIDPKEPADPRATAHYGKTTPSEKGGKVGGGNGEGGWYAGTTPTERDPVLASRTRAKSHAKRG
jgi:hypothetical protein